VIPDRVVVLSDFSWPLGGAEILALLNARLFAEIDIPVTFIAGDDGERSPIDRDKIEFLPLGGAPLLDRSLVNRSVSGIYNREVGGLIADYIADRDTPRTIYHLHNWSQIFSPSVFLALKPVASRLFISAHDFSLVCPNISYTNFQNDSAPCMLKPLSRACLLTHCDRRSYSHKLWRSARSISLRYTLHLTQSKTMIGIIHPSMSERYERGGIPRNRLQVLRNPVNPFTTERVKAEDNSDIFFVGRVVHEKGVDLAAEAARLAGRRLRIIGDGDMRAALEKRYSNIAFEGWKSHDEIGQLIREARAMLVPSRAPEAFTLVAHEAMRSGVPVIAFSDVDCQEAADIGGAIVAPPREASSLAGAIRRLDDNRVTERMSRIAFAEGWRFSNTSDTWRSALLDQYSKLLTQSVATRAMQSGTRHLTT
jgi:glycosyltransferase involved in cell wall biosynthesis